MKTLQALLRLIIHAFQVCDNDLADSIKDKDVPSIILNLGLIALMVLVIVLALAVFVYLSFKFWWILFIGFVVIEVVFALVNKGGTDTSEAVSGEVDIELARLRAKELYPILLSFMFRVMIAVSQMGDIKRMSDPHDIETNVTNEEHFYMDGANPIYQFELPTVETITQEAADRIRDDLQKAGENYIREYPALITPEAAGRTPFEILTAHPLGKRVCVDIVLTTSASIGLIEKARKVRLERQVKQKRAQKQDQPTPHDPLFK